MIAHRHKLIFIHIPRNAGTSVETRFGDMTGHHARASWYARRYPRDWATYQKAAIIRDPEDRFASLWRYWRHLDKQNWGVLEDGEKRERCWWRFRARVGDDVEAFARALPELAAEPWTDGHFRPQSWFLNEEGVQLLTIAEATELWGLERLNQSAAHDEVSFPIAARDYYSEDRELAA